MQAGQLGPPQSMPVSVPSRTPFVQLAAAAQRPPVQIPLAQSAGVVHARPTAQGRQGPPQSTSDSPAESMPSEQVGATHSPCMQEPDAQITPTHAASTHMLPWQTWNAAHGVPEQVASTQAPPAQRWPAGHATSLQLASTQTPATHTCPERHGELEQLRGRQLPWLQAWSAAHVVAQLPQWVSLRTTSTHSAAQRAWPFGQPPASPPFGGGLFGHAVNEANARAVRTRFTGRKH
jgi:hypothetical protein